MDTQFIDKVEKKYVKRDLDVQPGDTVKVYLRITEGGKERVQVFEGVVIAIKGSGLGKSITVRKISHGVGVEKILPINSPIVKKIDVTKRGEVRRSKLYYMRDKVGKRSLDVQLDEEFEEILGTEETTKEDVKEETDSPESKEEPKKESKEKDEKKPGKKGAEKASEEDSKEAPKKEVSKEEKPKRSEEPASK